MSVLVGREAPDFRAQAVMPDGSFSEVQLASYRGKKVLLFFYPLDFTFVCPSEIIAFHNRVQDFAERDTAVLGVSVDSHFTHLAWRKTPVEKGGIGAIGFPLVSDLAKSIARDYGVLAQDGAVAYRGLFLIDESGRVRHQLVNDLPLGRSVDEALRIVDALAFHSEHGEVCPANWKQGAEGMSPSPEGVATYLAQNATRL